MEYFDDLGLDFICEECGSDRLCVKTVGCTRQGGGELGVCRFSLLVVLNIPLQEGDTVESQWTRRRFHKERLWAPREDGPGLHSHVGCSPKKETGGFEHHPVWEHCGVGHC